MLALIDGDIVTHRVGFTTEQEKFGIAKARCDEMLDGILIDTDATEYRIYLSDTTENGFRREIYPEYKMNRVAPKPKHYDRLKEYLLTEWSAKITLEQEADDALGIDQDKVGYKEPPHTGEYKTVICTIDKDLLQIPGIHWNFVKKEWREISPEEGMKRFYHQLIMGDTADNVKGVRGIGEVKAARILGQMTKENDMFEATYNTYADWLKVLWNSEKLDEFQTHQVYNIILTNGRVLKIRQEENELWHFPQKYKKVEPTLVAG